MPTEAKPAQVFLSHNSRDKDLVRPLFAWLKNNLAVEDNVFFDERDIELGDNIVSRLERALDVCTCGIVCFGNKGLGPWHEQEIGALLNLSVSHSHHNSKGTEFRLIPVLLTGAKEDELPHFIRTKLWADLRGGLEGKSLVLERLKSAIKGEPTTASIIRLDPSANPYRGLAPFTEQKGEDGTWDFQVFYGRDQKSEALASELKREKFVLISGASGTGKSSLARAGLMTDAAELGCKGIREWHRLRLVPSHDFLFSLGEALEGKELTDSLRKTAGHAARTTQMAQLLFESLCRRFPDREKDRVLIIIDQFEELFTLGGSANASRPEAQRQMADSLDMLASLASDAYRNDGRFHWVLTLRSEFVPRCRLSPSFWAFLEAENCSGGKPHHMRLDDLDETDWRAAIKAPAEGAGAYFQEGLITTILKDVRKQAGSMPLLQHALQVLWQRTKGVCLTLDDYTQSGGVVGALSQTADTVLEDITKKSTWLEADLVCRSILLRLISFGEGVPDTRRRVHRREFDFGTQFDDTVNRILEKLQASRLVRQDGDVTEVTHEALIRECATLGQWISDARKAFDLPFFRQLTDAANAWQSDGKRPADLWPAHRVARAKDLPVFKPQSSTTP